MKILNFLLLSGVLAFTFGCSTPAFQDYDKGGGSSGQLNDEMGGESSKDGKGDESVDFSAFEKETQRQSSSSLEKRFEYGVHNKTETQMLNAGSELLARSPENVKVLNGFGAYSIKSNMPDAAKIYFER